jgi:hypothetical protein
VWLVFVIPLPYSSEIICQHQNTNQGCFPSYTSSSHIVFSDCLCSYNFMPIIKSIALSKTLGLVQTPQTILSTVNFISLLQYRIRASETSSKDIFCASRQSVSHLTPDQDHIRLGFLGRPYLIDIFLVHLGRDGSSKNSRSMSRLYICKVQVLSLLLSFSLLP